MRRLAMLGLTMLLPACQDHAGNPFVGFGGFVGDTVSFHTNPNLPPGDSPNMLRVKGRAVETEPLTPEAGNVWPGPVMPEPTLLDIEKGEGLQPKSQVPGPHGSSTPPGPAGSLPPAPPARSPPSPSLPPAPPPQTKFYPTPSGPAPGTSMGNGVQTYTDPKGGIGIVVPNGNGTSTLIGPDGSVTTVPSPR